MRYERMGDGTEGIRGLGRGADIALSIFMVFLSVIILLPVAFIISISFSSERSIAGNGYRFIADEWSLDAYRYLAGSAGRIVSSFTVTVFITVVGTVLSLILISTMAYAISRNDYRFSRLYTAMIMLPMFFGGGLAASYAVNTQVFGLKNTILALILPTACSSWYILVMRTYFRYNIPGEILEAARIDGASTYRIFGQFVLPMSRPIIITVGIFEAFGYWNSWYENLLYTDSDHGRYYTLQYVLYNMEKSAAILSSSENISGSVIADIPTESFRMALAVVIIAPIIVSYPFFRKYLVKGLTAGAGK
ncbi:MAG: carbohydrate ABC transporter permease [Lachnospiraceae bacterium]|nr:carbohydrate ABC transporter permease [Lachnospiraceae bacterium]